MQTSVQKADSIRFWSWSCEIQETWGWWTNIWMINDATLEVEKIIKEFIWANAKMPPKAKIQTVKFNFNLFELDLSNINLINWDWSLSSVEWSEINITDEALWTWWTIWTPIKLTNKNWDNTQVTNIVIAEDWTPLIENTDYDTYVWNWINWEKWLTYIVPLTDQTWVITADYDYTPNDSNTIKFWDADKSLALRAFRFTHTYDDSKIFRITIFKWYNSQWINIAFKWDEDEDPASTPISISAFPDSSALSDNVNMFEIYDEKSV